MTTTALVERQPEDSSACGGDDDSAGGEATWPRIVARDDGELWAKEQGGYL